jgi:hypothetical protein
MWLLFACTPPDTTAPEATPTAAEIPVELPPHGGCTLVETHLSFGSDITTTTVYDAEEREISVVTEESNTRQSVEYLYTYDGACQVGYSEEWRSGRTSELFEWTGTCDDQDHTTYRLGTYQGAFYELEVVYTYDDGGNTIAIDGAYTVGATETTFDATAEWVDDLPIRSVSRVNGEFSQEERWTWEDDLLTLYEKDKADPAESSTYANTYDEHGRITEVQYTYGGADSGASFNTWMDTIFHTSQEEYERIGYVGNPTQTWVCSDTFPWACDGEGDGMDGSEPDGAVDTLSTEVWTCP